MRRPHFPDPDLDRLFRGEDVDPALTSSLANAGRELRAGPPAEVASAHIARIVGTARELRDRPALRPAPVAPRGAPLRMFRRVAVTFAVVLLAGASSMVGLAYAGVALPSAVLTAFKEIGIHLPNQGHERGWGRVVTPSTASPHGQDVKTVATTGPHGCAHGRAVSSVAGAGRQDAHVAAHRQDAGHQTTDPCAQGRHENGGSVPLPAAPSPTAPPSPSPTGGATSGQNGQGHSGSMSGGTTHGRSGQEGHQSTGKHTGTTTGHNQGGRSIGSNGLQGHS